MDTNVRETLRRAALEARLRVEAVLARQGWLQTLPSRLVLGVFSTVLVTSLAVAFTATHSTETFLRDGIDRRFPAVLAQAAKRMDLWYDQRQLDVDTFARSEIVRDHLQALAHGARGRQATRAREELQHYLDYVLERFPQYVALFVLDRNGKTVLWTGAETPLPEPLRETLASVDHPRVGDLRVADGVRSQLASSPVSGSDDEPVGSLHAVLALEQLDALLQTDDLSDRGRILAVRGVEVLAPAGASGVPDATPPSDEVAELETPDGDSVIAARLDLDRFGWSLWVIEPYDAAFEPVVAVVHRVWAVNLAIVLVLGVVAFLIARSMARPIHELSRAAHGIAGGAENVAIPLLERSDEVGVLSRALRKMTARLAAEQAELRRANEILTQLSVTDGLTGLHNHRAFQDRLARDTRRAQRTGASLCLLLLDVDDFKALNDQHGHATGDRVLAAVGAILNEGIDEADFVARYGGEEFALLSPVSLEDALTLGENLRRAIAATTVESESGDALRVTVSGGVARLETDGDALFATADRALYRAKQSGKDCVFAVFPDEA